MNLAAGILMEIILRERQTLGYLQQRDLPCGPVDGHVAVLPPKEVDNVFWSILVSIPCSHLGIK